MRTHMCKRLISAGGDRTRQPPPATAVPFSLLSRASLSSVVNAREPDQQQHLCAANQLHRYQNRYQNRFLQPAATTVLTNSWPRRTFTSKTGKAQSAFAHNSRAHDQQQPEDRPEPTRLTRNGVRLKAMSLVTGKRQSPIDIVSAECPPVSGLSALRCSYPSSMAGLSILNTGYGWKVDIPEALARQTSLSGGPLDDNYILEQFHAHWGRDCKCGSEHTVDGRSYAAELHLVHWNADRFNSFPEAAAHDKGLAVIGVFLDIGKEPNQEFDKLTKHMQSILYKNQSAPLTNELSIDGFLPKDRQYWSYEGSLTTPPFYETVSWLLMSSPILVTEEQLVQFRLLYHCGAEDGKTVGDRVVENYRDAQELCQRTVAYVANS